MDDLLIIGGVVVALLLLSKKGSASITVSTSPGDAIPTSTSISGGPIVSGGYQVAPPSQTIGAGLAPSTSSSLPTYLAPPTAFAPPPSFVGGAAGTAGSGGNPLGGFRLGLAPLIGTSVPGFGGAYLRRQLPRRPGLGTVRNLFPVVRS